VEWSDQTGCAHRRLRSQWKRRADRTCLAALARQARRAGGGRRGREAGLAAAACQRGLPADASATVAVGSAVRRRADGRVVGRAVARDALCLPWWARGARPAAGRAQDETRRRCWGQAAAEWSLAGRLQGPPQRLSSPSAISLLSASAAPSPSPPIASIPTLPLSPRPAPRHTQRPARHALPSCIVPAPPSRPLLQEADMRQDSGSCPLPA
jgi:hypothetical protein